MQSHKQATTQTPIHTHSTPTHTSLRRGGRRGRDATEAAPEGGTSDGPCEAQDRQVHRNGSGVGGQAEKGVLGPLEFTTLPHTSTLAPHPDHTPPLAPICLNPPIFY
jgi:hypothetical protein